MGATQQLLVSHGSPSVAPLSVYAFLDLAGTADTVITASLLNSCMKGAVPGTWELGDCLHSGVQSVPANLNHTLLRTQSSYDLVPALTCNGGTFTSVVRKIECDQDAAVAPADWETVIWVPGEPISGNFMVAFCYESNKTMGSDGLLSMDVVAITYGGNGTIFQVQQTGPGAFDARPHGGSKVPLLTGVRYRVQLLCDVVGERSEFWVSNDATGEFVGATSNIYEDAVVLVYAKIGDYLVNGDDGQSVSGVYFQKDAAAEFSNFTLPPVTDLEFEQTAIDTGVLSFNSGAISFLIEKNTDGGGWSTLETNFYAPRTSIADLVEYEDATVSDGESVVYRVTAHVRAVTSSAEVSDAVVIDNGLFAEPTWTDALAGTSTNTDDAYGHNPTMQPVVCGTTGSCVKIRVWLRYTNDPFDVKVALYNSSHVKIGQGIATGLEERVGAWAEVVLDTPVAVTASTTYGLGFCFSNNSDGITGYLDGQPANSSYLNFGGSYATFPDDPFIVAGSGITAKFAIGMGVI